MWKQNGHPMQRQRKRPINNIDLIRLVGAVNAATPIIRDTLPSIFFPDPISPFLQNQYQQK
jgi:hypothetical protein